MKHAPDQVVTAPVSEQSDQSSNNSGGGGRLALILIVLILALYFLPTVIASVRQHRNAKAILL